MAELPRPLPPPSWRDRLDVAGVTARVPTALIVVVLVVIIVAAVGFTAVTRATPKADVALSLPQATPVTVGVATGETPTSVAPGPLHVHAAGAVNRPGVVELPAGARVSDVVTAAGGPSADADLDLINLAAPVKDGERVYIPRRGEAPPIALGSGSAGAGATGDAGSSTSSIVNLNEADQAQLETLPGVGPATAKAILDYRTEHGRFRSVDDLLNVRGIGPSKLEQIKPFARV